MHGMHENKTRKYSCKLCSFVGSRRKEHILAHMESEHPNDKFSSFEIIEIEKQQKKISDIVTNVHSPKRITLAEDIEISDYYCDLCIYETDEENNLTNHLITKHFSAIYGK